jgi:hypothetical protein
MLARDGERGMPLHMSVYLVAIMLAAIASAGDAPCRYARPDITLF